MKRGVVGLALAFLVVALGLLAWCGVAIVQSQEAQAWTGTQCTVVDVQLRDSARAKRRSRRKLSVQYTYVVDGQTHRGDQWNVMQGSLDTDADEGKTLLQAFRAGSTHPCWYDPTNIPRAVLDRSRPSAVYWLPLFSGVLITAGLWLLRRSRSAPSP